MFTHLYTQATSFMALPEAQCIRTNNSLNGLDPLINKLEGAFGGLLFILGPAMFVILIVAALILAVSNKGSAFLKLAFIVLFIPLLAITAMAVYNGLIGGANGIC